MLAELPLALSTRVGVHLHAGETKEATALVDESDALARAIGGGIVPRYGSLALAAYRGQDDDFTSLFRSSAEDFLARGEGLGITAANWWTALLNNSVGRYEAAFAAARCRPPAKAGRRGSGHWLS